MLNDCVRVWILNAVGITDKMEPNELTVCYTDINGSEQFSDQDTDMNRTDRTEYSELNLVPPPASGGLESL